MKESILKHTSYFNTEAILLISL